MNRPLANILTCSLIGLLSVLAIAQNPTGKRWIGTWATAPQLPMPGHVQSFRNQTLRLIVHTSAGGTKVRIKISNSFGDHPLLVGGAHIARRTDAAEIDPTNLAGETFRSGAKHISRLLTGPSNGNCSPAASRSLARCSVLVRRS